MDVCSFLKNIQGELFSKGSGLGGMDIELLNQYSCLDSSITPRNMNKIC